MDNMPFLVLLRLLLLIFLYAPSFRLLKLGNSVSYWILY